MRYSKEQINEILHLFGADGSPIDIFNLHGILFIGNVQGRIWDITKTYIRHSDHSVPIVIEDFEYCETEDDVRDQFRESLRNAVMDKLI